ncbi:MAG: signal peptidase II [Novosphingobium sp.]
MSLTRNHSLGLAFAATVFAIDQLVKWLVTGPLDLPNVLQIEILPFFRLSWAENTGVSLGLLAAESDLQRWMLVGVQTAISMVALWYMMREHQLRDIGALGLVLGGACGNILDRVRFGYVVDYADLHFGTFRPFLIFNIADAAISIGVLLILARSLLSREKPQSTPKASGDTAPESQNHA